MTFISKTTIILAGTELESFKEIRLHQKIHAHHFLEARFPWQVLEVDRKELGNKSKEFLGETFAIKVTTNFNKVKLGELVFHGIVTGVDIIKSADRQVGDEIVLSVSSPDIIIDGGPCFDQFIEKDIGTIVKAITEDYESIKLTLNEPFSGKIDYVVQHDESIFEFIQRLSEQYGEWFYYNGEELIFGKPETTGIELSYRIDLTQYKINLVPQPLPTRYFSNDYLGGFLNKESPTDPTLSGMNITVFEKSKNVYKSNSEIWANTNNDPAAENILKHKVKVQQESIALNMVRVSGSSKNPGVALGKVVKIEGVDYRIVQVDHFVNGSGSGHYENQFTGVSAKQNGYPRTNVKAFPFSLSQIGIVKENHDPEGLGRVRVQFPWQIKQGKLTCWIRVVSMQAGKGGGMFRIPHKGDEVIVDFENGNAEMPYTSGSLYTPKSKPPEGSSDPDNNFTVWQVGPCSITIDEGSGSITFVDKSSSMIYLDGNGEVTISAETNLNILALNGEINIDSPIINIGSEASIPDLTNIHGNTIHIHASQLLELLSDIELKAQGMKTKIEGTTEVVVQGTKATVNGTAMTEIKGGQVKLN